MNTLQNAKSVVRAYMEKFDQATMPDRLTALQEFAAPDYTWRGMHPFHELDSAKAAVITFWAPLLEAFSDLQRREDVFLAGYNDCDGETSIWTCSMGHLLGLFDKNWLGILPTGKTTLLRYAEFHRIKDGKIAESVLFCDILSVMSQAGQNPLPPQTGADFIYPGPRTHDGILLEERAEDEGRKTLALVNRMASDISRANEILQGKRPGEVLTPHDEMAQNWHDDMAWYGPTGIGATYTIDRYIEQHQTPFRTQLANRVFNGHVARIAEGEYCGFFGWPNLMVTPIGGYMGLPGTGKPAPMRVVDVYRRAGDKLAENWVFIDILHFLNMQGLDVLGRLKVKRP